MNAADYRSVTRGAGSSGERAKNGSRRRGDAEERWRGILERWRRSGLDGRTFCRREGISEWSFYGWKRKTGLVEQRRTTQGARQRSPKSARFVPLSVCRVEVRHSPLELVLEGGRTVRIGGDFDPAVLRKLLAALEPTP